MAAPVPPDDSGDRMAAGLRKRRALLDRSSEAYVALAEHLDDEIAALEAAQRLARPALNVDFEELLDKAEGDARDA
jgi:hypothetical protein